MWIHHWVILQVINPLFTVIPGTDLDDDGPTGFKLYDFKNRNRRRFIHAVDDYYSDKNYDLIFMESIHRLELCGLGSA